ncbi:hypothetical protein [Acinetobacter bereziniae]|jgi:hypothetical protein|uniref:hypothetical protein n=1 Tax=Acinetobacter bereziniae TaxID=106648 RepID=UPI00124FF531|nr:hypothetical protein [Acinetobacter bereziniae]MCU4433972.1 hypothetical protein [Acinetobacter bereziniae]
MFKIKPLCLTLFSLSVFGISAVYADTLNPTSSTTLHSLSDDQLSETTGQALMSLSYLAPNDTSNLMTKYSNGSNIGFYKLGLEAEMDLNANIRNLQLGCGGINGAGQCDVDIKNLSLSGLPANYNPSSGNSPDFGAAGRASTSAKLTNPFMEFAVRNPNAASTREIVGLRFSAEKITGLLTAGLTNGSSPSSTDGIQTLSGFMRIAQTQGEVDTLGGKFGMTQDQSIGGNILVDIIGGLGFNRWVQSYPNAQNTSLCAGSDGCTTGITIPGLNSVKFDLPSFQVNGQRLNSALATDILLTLPSIPLAKPTGCIDPVGSPGYCNQWNNDQLLLNLRSQSNHNSQNCISIIIASACNAKFRMGEGSTLENLNLNVTFKQALSMFHNIPLNGTGGYLSLQQIALLWPGSYVDSSDGSGKSLNQMTKTDVAQKGWWMSFTEPVQLGYLKGANAVDITSVLPQVADLITTDLTKNKITLTLFDGLGALANQPVTKKMNIDIGPYTETNPARLTLQNLKLTNQEVSTNCYGSLKFC